MPRAVVMAAVAKVAMPQRAEMMATVAKAVTPQRAEMMAAEAKAVMSQRSEAAAVAAEVKRKSLENRDPPAAPPDGAIRLAAALRFCAARSRFPAPLQIGPAFPSLHPIRHCAELLRPRRPTVARRGVRRDDGTCCSGPPAARRPKNLPAAPAATPWRSRASARRSGGTCAAAKRRQTWRSRPTAKKKLSTCAQMRRPSCALRA